MELAVRCGADGVHVGQHDMEAGAVRRKIGDGMLLGVSVQTVEPVSYTHLDVYKRQSMKRKFFLKEHKTSGE